MISDLRTAFNAAFSPESYQRQREGLHRILGEQTTFRLAETPLFLPEALVGKLMRSCSEISEVLCSERALAESATAIRAPYWAVPGELGRPLFLQYDFAVCRENDELVPWLIELQGFPSLYFFQAALLESYRNARAIPAGYASYFSGLDAGSYASLLRGVILAGHPTENVILLEIDPASQNTRIDFAATHLALGVPVVGLEDLERDGRVLFYRSADGRRIPVKRIYNRVILDELLARDAPSYAYSFREEVDVEWAAHPDWFLRISKHSLPLLARCAHVPEALFASEYGSGSRDLREYVLKPLYSFSGAGVNIHPTEEDIRSLQRPENYILQKRVAYEPVLDTPSGKAKLEIRMMLVWQPGDTMPRPVNNLVRVSKGEMTGVKYNKDKDWVGASVGVFDQSPATEAS